MEADYSGKLTLSCSAEGKEGRKEGSYLICFLGSTSDVNGQNNAFIFISKRIIETMKIIFGYSFSNFH
jgi:hypothetical protein